MASADAVVRALGRELKRLRESLGMDREAVAELLRKEDVDIRGRTIASYEQSARDLSVRRLHELATIYGTPTAALLAKAVQQAGAESACPTCGHEQ